MKTQEEKYSQFTQDCKAAGLTVEQYQGRFFYRGPAVRCDNLQDVLCVTKIP